MSVNYNGNTINARLNVVVGQIDAAGAFGSINIYTANYLNLLSTIRLNFPCATVGGGVLTFSGTPLADPNIQASGIAASAKIMDAVGTVVVSGLTVGVSSSYDIVMSTTALSSNQTLALLSATITGN